MKTTKIIKGIANMINSDDLRINIYNDCIRVRNVWNKYKSEIIVDDDVLYEFTRFIENHIKHMNELGLEPMLK